MADTIELKQVHGEIGRYCIFCGETIILRSASDPTCVCVDCRKFLNERKKSHKSNWIPNSKGGEPNCRRG